MWGKANQAAFDPIKESVHNISKTESAGRDIKLLGVVFDVSLAMAAAVNEVVQEASWKLKMLLRTKRFHNDAELIVLYKSHLLVYLEYRTPAVYHATPKVLERLDHVRTRFLRDAGVDEATALMNFNLAPLSARRDIAMLGVLHRTVLGKGPPQFKQHFKLEAGRKLKDPRSELRDPIVSRSALGLVAIYNLLPDRTRAARDLKDCQSRLQQIMKERLSEGCADWETTFSRRTALERHPLAAC